MTAPLPPAPALLPRRTKLPSIPAPDSTEGRALIVALIVGIFYALLLVGANTPLSNFDWVWIPLVLVLATIVSFQLSARLDSDHARAEMLELELARTVAVHAGSGQLPGPGSPLGRVLTEYARTADAMRRRARAHAYAAGPALWGAAFALVAAVLWGLSVTGAVDWVNYLAIVVELPALVLLFYTVGALALNIGGEREVEGFVALTPRRMRRYASRSATYEATIAEVPWLGPEASEPAPAPALPPEPSSEPRIWSEQPTS